MKKKTIAAFFAALLTLIMQAQTPQLWGLAYQGGSGNYGTIMKINGDGTGFNSFNLNRNDGFYPGGHLVLEKDNLLYGMTFGGGSFGSGSLFSMNPEDSVFSNIFSINKTGNTNVFSDLVAGNDSIIYGILYEGGALFKGAIFGFNYLTHTTALLFQVGDTTQGANPRNMIWAANNKLYGVTDSGGLFSAGVIFSFDPATNTYTDVHDFDTINFAPCGSLVQADNGLLYGLTSAGGANGWGVIYSFDTGTNSFTKLYDFAYADGLPYYNNGMIRATNNMLYGMAENGGNNNWGTIFRFDPSSNTFGKLYNLDSVNGKWPAGKLMQASDGKLYGMTTNGGTNDPEYDGDGVIFSFDYTDTLYVKLKDLSELTGINPYSSLTEYSPTSAIEQIENVHPLLLYPNPASTQIIIQIPGGYNYGAYATLAITNTLGQLISKQPVKQALISFDVSNLANGIYYMNLINGVNTWQGKFVKE